MSRNGPSYFFPHQFLLLILQGHRVWYPLIRQPGFPQVRKARMTKTKGFVWMLCILLTAHEDTHIE